YDHRRQIGEINSPSAYSARTYNTNGVAEFSPRLPESARAALGVNQRPHHFRAQRGEQREHLSGPGNASAFDRNTTKECLNYPIKSDDHRTSMKLPSLLTGLLLFLSASLALAQDDFKPEPGYVSLFNGKDLTGWGYKTNNFDGKTASDDGRYSASDGILTVHPRVPRLVQQISTTQQFSNDFNLKLEFRAST